MSRAANTLRLSFLVLATACGAGSAIRPADPSAAGALGQGAGGAICQDAYAEGTPLIVDWRPEDREDLEVAMKKGVAFVHYDCHGIRLVPDCRVEGAYGFVGTTRREQLVSLKNADEAKANLPWHGGELGAAIGADSSLDIGLVMIGKQTTTFTEIPKADLPGACDGATHFVRSATLGAYAMQTATAGSVTSAAQLFGVGASGGSTSAKQTSSRDGDPDSCQKADPDAPKPPAQCGAPLRVQLVAIGAGERPVPTGLACPAGLVSVGGKCATSADEAVKKCQRGDAAACETSCRADVVESCNQWGSLMIDKALKEKSTAYDGPMAEAFRRACDLHDEINCAMLAINTATGRGVPQDGARALALASHACLDGAPVGCTVVAGMFDRGQGVPVDRTRGTRLYERACNAGDGTGCIAAAQAYAEGRPGIAVDRAKMADYFGRACDAGEAWGCVNAGKASEAGDGVPANPARAAGYYRRGCEKKNAAACAAAKRLAP